jgi:hypothetical protein
MKYWNSNGNNSCIKARIYEDRSNRFTDKYLEMVGRGIPSRLVRIRLNDKPWFNSEIRKEIRTRNRLLYIIREEDWDHINRFNPAIFVCLSDDKTLITIVFVDVISVFRTCVFNMGVLLL